MLVGYMRVSSDNNRQTTDLQRDALIQAGVDERHLFEEKASGARDDRSGLAQALDYIRAGDCLVVWKLDRLGRSLSHLGLSPICSHAVWLSGHSPNRWIPRPRTASFSLVCSVRWPNTTGTHQRTHHGRACGGEKTGQAGRTPVCY